MSNAKKERIKVAITDIDGVMRGKFISRAKFESVRKSGIAFCSVVFGWDMHDETYTADSVTGWDVGFRDFDAVIDEQTRRVAPWSPDNTLYLMDFPDCAACPRALLRRVVGEAQALGYDPMCALEYEWFNFAETSASAHDKGFRGLEPMSRGNCGYSALRIAQHEAYVHDLFDMLPAFGVPIEALHTETGPGVLEVALEYTHAVEMADRAVCFKEAVREIATRHGVLPTFMAKISEKLAGSGAHIHQSLFVKGTTTNAFHDAADPQGMSTVMRHFLAGQLHCLPFILPMYAPTVNSYKRLVEGMWAPTKPSWGVENRTTTHRVIQGPEDVRHKATRIECRVGGADINAYLALAASIASGLYGVRHKLELPAEAAGNVYARADIPNIPGNLLAAVDAMEGNLALASELFGEGFAKHLIATRRWEARKFAMAVTDFELQRYLEMV